jgi:hypothetical protein
MMVTITVNPIPVARAGPDQTVMPGTQVSLDGSASFDPVTRDPLTYDWAFVSRPNGSDTALAGATTVNPSFTADVPGSYVVRLIVHDGVSPSRPDNVTVTANSRPTANAGPDNSGNFGNLFTLDGSLSSDPDGDSLSYNWDFTGVPSGCHVPVLVGSTTARPSFTTDCTGDYTLRLFVNDGKLESVPDFVLFNVFSIG